MLTYGFFNSSGGDRKYNADQMSAIFNGIINDGIFMSEGDNFVVVESANMIVNVGTGRAWFDGKWILNNAAYAITIDAAEAILNRIDVVVIEIDESDSVRACSLKVVKGTPGASPTAPTLTNTADVHQYPLAEIYVGAAVTEIVQANITNKVGSVDTPYITGILDTVDTTALLAQWDDEFTTWFASVQNILDASTAGNLLAISTDLYLTTNVGNAYSITTGLSLTSLPGGYPICVEFNADATGAISINVDGLGAFPGLKASGDPVTNVKAGGIYTFRSDGTGNFILQGEGASGDAVAADLLSGKTATTDAGEITGTMPNIGQENITPSTIAQSISEGYHDGTGEVSGDADLIANNIRAGVDIFGVTGAVVEGLDEFFGDGSDGVLNTGSTLASTLNGPAVIKEYTSINLTSGTLTLSNPCQGLILYSQGDINIGSGVIIDMNKKAGISPKANIIPMPITKQKSNLSTPTLEKYFQLTSILENIIGGNGGGGGSGGSADTTSGGTGGTGGAGRQNLGGFGGGGGGGAAANSGGGAGGSINLNECVSYPKSGRMVGYVGYLMDGPDGVGGFGAFNRTTSATGVFSANGQPRGGGSGGSGGNWASSGTGTLIGSLASEYAGGFIMLIAGGNININSGATIRASGGSGSSGADATSASTGTNQKAGGGGGGGGAGGGCVLLLHKGSLTNNGTIQVSGGSGGAGGQPYFPGSGNAGASGSSGSVGTIRTQQL